MLFQIDLRNDPLLRVNPFLQESDNWKETRNELAPAFTALKVGGFINDFRENLNIELKSKISLDDNTNNR